MTKTVLIIEDSKEIADLVSLHLQDLGFQTTWISDGNKGFQTALSAPFDLIILDLMLPGMEGVEICRRLRTEKIKTPILMLTAKSEELDIVLGLELGADDYMIKPFRIRELIARVKAIFRRIESTAETISSKQDEPVLKFGELTIDLPKRKVLLKNEIVDLTAKEFDMLHLFASHPGHCYSRQQLLDEIWGYQFEGYDHTVNSHINRLRSKIEEDRSKPRYIQTVWGVGYKFMEPEEWVD
ncbi:MAG: response regulator transcription factor [SAR324 cluster bacterium]|nr:response regulator transcription factor [SAR324 cluster bacterium]